MAEKDERKEGEVARWRDLEAKQEERLKEAKRTRAMAETAVKRLAARAALGREDAKRDLRKKQAALRALDADCQMAAADLQGAKENLSDAERAQDQARLAAEWRHCRDLAKKREALAADLEQHLAAAATALRELDQLGLQLHERAPRRAAWLGRGGVISGAGLLARVAVALHRAGLPGGGPQMMAEGTTLQDRERELHDAYLKQAYK